MTTEIIDDEAGYDSEPCKHPEHNPPTAICIPSGKAMRHTCPGCGRVIVVTAPKISC